MPHRLLELRRRVLGVAGETDAVHFPPIPFEDHHGQFGIVFRVGRTEHIFEVHLREKILEVFQADFFEVLAHQGFVHPIAQIEPQQVADLGVGKMLAALHHDAAKPGPFFDHVDQDDAVAVASDFRRDIRIPAGVLQAADVAVHALRFVGLASRLLHESQDGGGNDRTVAAAAHVDAGDVRRARAGKEAAEEQQPTDREGDKLNHGVRSREWGDRLDLVLDCQSG